MPASPALRLARSGDHSAVAWAAEPRREGRFGRGGGPAPRKSVRFGWCTEATPRIRGQPRWLRRRSTTAWGRWMDCAPGCHMPGRCVRRTAPSQRPAPAPAADRIGCRASNRGAQAMRARQHVRTSCRELREAVLGSGCNAQRRVARCWRVANMSECRPTAPRVGGCLWKASFAVEVRSLWSRCHVRTRPG